MLDPAAIAHNFAELPGPAEDDEPRASESVIWGALPGGGDEEKEELDHLRVLAKDRFRAFGEFPQLGAGRADQTAVLAGQLGLAHPYLLADVEVLCRLAPGDVRTDLSPYFPRLTGLCFFWS